LNVIQTRRDLPEPLPLRGKLSTYLMAQREPSLTAAVNAFPFAILP